MLLVSYQRIDDEKFGMRFSDGREVSRIRERGTPKGHEARPSKSVERSSSFELETVRVYVVTIPIQVFVVRGGS